MPADDEDAAKRKIDRKDIRLLMGGQYLMISEEEMFERVIF